MSLIPFPAGGVEVPASIGLASVASILTLARLIPDLASFAPDMANTALFLANAVPDRPRLSLLLANSVPTLANATAIQAKVVLFMAKAKETSSLSGPAGEKGRGQHRAGG